MTLFDPQAFDPVRREPSSPRRPVDVVRPIQYLGNKQRSLSTILSVIESTVPQHGAIADFFSGTSVVAQGIASLGRRSVAVDVSPACAVIARATLGVARGAGAVDSTQLTSLLNDEAAAIEHELRCIWAPYIAAEADALRVGDGEHLLELGQAVPQVWRNVPSTSAVDDALAEWARSSTGGVACQSILTPVYAGSYFSVLQAVELDARRRAVASMADRGDIDPWEEAALITSLLSAASLCAFSPGKHFAQPHRIDATKDLTFHAGRALTDRALSVAALAAESITTLTRHARSGAENHVVLERTVDDVTPDDLVAAGVAAVYADPPYTAQQYSRFYHVLDTLAAGVPKPLQLLDGRATSGLYPDGRYLSPYCSKRQARPAFSRLAGLCRKAEASLLLSYSASSKESTGNARMISLAALLDVLASHYGRDEIEVVEFAHNYRQFNHRDSARPNRADPEVLVIAHAP